MQESAVPDIDRCHLLPHAEVVVLLELRPGMPVAEMGAHQGRITSSLSNAVGPEGRVYGLEREPEPLASLGEKRKSQPNMANLLAELYDRSTPPWRGIPPASGGWPPIPDRMRDRWRTPAGSAAARADRVREIVRLLENHNWDILRQGSVGPHCGVEASVSDEAVQS
jgi:hypothetical protein